MIKTEIKEFPLLYMHPHGRAIVGWGGYKMAGQECKAYGIKHALLVTTGLKRTGIVEEVKGVLEYAGVAATLFDGISSNPKDREVAAAYKVYKDARCDGVVSVGGGSSHDAGKAVRLLASNEGEETSLRNFAAFLHPDPAMKVPAPKPVAIPQVAINTTCGTGADCTGGAVVTDSDWVYKMILVAPGITPSVGISDPLLMRSQPPHIAAGAGMDAFVHALEAMVGRLNFPVAHATGRWAIKLIAENLREVVANRNNDAALENMAWAQLIAAFGYNMGGGMGMVHGISHGISALKDLHHGRANAIMLVPVERFNMIAKPKAFADVAACFGVDTRGMTVVQAAEKALEEMERLRNDVGFTDISLKQLNLTEENIEHVAKWALNDINYEGNPRGMNQTQVKEILRGLLN